MSELPFQLPRVREFNDSGSLLPGAKLSFFVAGSVDTLQSIYTDAALSTEHSNPVIALASGRFPAIWTDPELNYKIRLDDASDNLIYEDDNIQSVLTQAAVGKILYPRTATEIAAGVTPVDFAYEELDARRYGYVADDATDNTTALVNADLVATQYGGAYIRIPDGTGQIISNVTIHESNGIVGNGNGSIIHCVACSLRVDAVTQADGVEWTRFSHFAIKRTGTAGYPMEFISESGNHVANVLVEKVRILESTGGGIDIQGLIGGVFIEFQVEDCTGIAVNMDPQASARISAIEFIRGNIIRNGTALFMDTVQNVSFRGTVFENNTVAGCDITHNCQTITFDSCWFEANAAYDIRIGDDSTSGDSHVMSIVNCQFNDGSPAKDASIETNIIHQLWIDRCRFDGYGVEAINNDPTSATAVDGHIGSHIFLLGSTPAVITNPSRFFYQHIDARGTDVATLTGFATDPTPSVRWQRNGMNVILNIPATTGTSDATTMTLTGIDSDIHPIREQEVLTRAQDNTGTAAIALARIQTNGTITFFASDTETGWTASGTKGFPRGVNLTWTID